jgi:hypothetical protein
MPNPKGTTKQATVQRFFHTISCFDPRRKAIMSEELRAKVLSEFAKYTGQIKPAAFFKETYRFIPEIERFHNLVTGIFKPAWSKYALCISMKQGSIYEHKDAFVFLEDGRWMMDYSPKRIDPTAS